MRVLFADALDDVASKQLIDDGWDVMCDPGLRDDALAMRIRELNPHALVVRSTRIRAEHVADSTALGLIVRAGAGVNTNDLEACSDRGIFVANTPGQNALAVAELTLGLLVACDRNVVSAAAEVRAGRWRKAHHASGARGLHGRTLAILGMGAIGEAVAWRARGFGMNLRAWSRSLDAKRARLLRVTPCATPAEAVRGADAVTVHCAATDDTHHLVSASLLAQMPDGCIVLNTSRHELVDEDALLDVVVNRGFRVGADVLSVEPKGAADVAHPLLSHPGVTVTPHLGASTKQAAEAVALAVCDVLDQWRHTGRVDSAVNVARSVGRDGTLIVRHLDRVGVLAGVLDRLRHAQVNVGEMENITLNGRRAAIARIGVSGAVSQDVLTDLNAMEHVIRAAYTVG